MVCRSHPIIWVSIIVCAGATPATPPHRYDVVLKTAVRQLQDSTASSGGSSGDQPAGTISDKCRTSFISMVNDPNFIYANTSFANWCRMVLENEMANCCTKADFAKGKAEGCQESCWANCLSTPMRSLCDAHFGVGCSVVRFPFHRTGAPKMRVEETFCVPHMCNNFEDQKNLLMFYEIDYVRRRSGWLLAWDNVRLHCPGMLGPAIGWTFFGVVMASVLGGIGYILFVAPKERGRTMISQEQMADAADDASSDASGK